MRVRVEFIAIWLAFVVEACSATPSPLAGSSKDDKPLPSSASTEANSSDAPECGKPVGGSRLQVKRLLGDDGSWQFDGWYDTEREENCALINAADGNFRCLPLSSAASTIVYADGGCSQKATVSIQSCDDQDDVRYALKREELACEVRMHLYAVGANLGALPSVYQNTNGSCSEVKLEGEAVAPNATWSVFEVLDEVPASHFVAVERELTGKKLQGLSLTFADGSTHTQPAYIDGERHVRCTPQVAADGVLRCLPLPIGTAHANATCSDPITLARPRECSDLLALAGSSQYALSLEVQSDDLCSQPALNHVFAVGEETRNLEQVYIESGDGCILDSQAPSTNYKSVGDELPASQFAHLTVQEAECGPALQSGTRLRALYFADEHGGKLEGFFVDSKFDAVCSYFDAADGVSRCLPGGARYGGYYLDAECTHEAGAISVCEARTSTGPLLAGFRQDFAWVSLPPLDDCSLPRAQVHPLLGSGQAAGYLRDAAGDCNPVNQPDLTFYELGPAFDPSEFVARNAER